MQDLSDNNSHRTARKVDCLVLGGGLTGLTLAYRLSRGCKVHLLERMDMLGGAIQTYREGGFVYEAGPSTGIVSRPEVAELMESLSDPTLLVEASPSARRRLIYQRGQFRPLPSGLWSAVRTPLFSLGDKFRILLEPWRSRGTDPDESVASLTRRRLGKSFFTYAIDPFIGGIYAGDPETLVTRHALPKLYALERDYGSFVRGAIAKAREPKTPRDRKASKRVFSTRAGLSSLIEVLTERLGEECVTLGASIRAITRTPEGLWHIETQSGSYLARRVVSTIGAHALATLPLGASDALLESLRIMRYAPVVQVAVGYRDARGVDFDAFGGLVPSCEDDELLGILNPSAGFAGRAPDGGILLSVFLGGMRSPKLIERSDEEIRNLVLERLSAMLGIHHVPDLVHIFRHQYGIPQYEASSDRRLEAIAELERLYPGFIIGGNLHGGIGMADRIAQAYALAERINSELNSTDLAQ